MPMYETTVRTPQGEEKKRIYADTPQEAKKLFENNVNEKECQTRE